MEFYSDSYLLSAGEDNAICIWRVNDWVCVHTLGGHKDVVNDLSIHPSGKMAISVSKDNTMKLWNLIEGRCGFTRRLKGPAATMVSWNKTGDFYLLVSGTSVKVYAAEDNSCSASLNHTSRVNKATFIPSLAKIKGSIESSSSSSSYLLVLCEDRTLTLYSASGNKISSICFPEEMKRTRDLSVCRVNSKSETDNILYSISVVTSSGTVIVLNLAGMFDKGGDVTFEGIYHSSFSIKVEPRMTCITSWAVTGKARKEKKEEDEEEAAVSSAILGGGGVGGKKRKGSADSLVDDNQKQREIDKLNAPRPKKVRFGGADEKGKEKKKNKKKKGSGNKETGLDKRLKAADSQSGINKKKKKKK